MPTPTIERRVRNALAILTKLGDASPATLARRTPGLVVLLSGRHTGATAAHAKLLRAIDSLDDAPATAARALLGIGLPGRTTRRERRAVAGEAYRVGWDQFSRAYEPRVITALVIALIDRADPAATYPTPSLIVQILRNPPPPASAFRPRLTR
ncbi:hypothetical protein I6A84_30840 [Frankia sp. CNm7]|uniref:Uncharacterized protein n=1 Tax=Frankia nepalensis TaxID=1836974 RepID=A0A937RT80_9ACTN|nr:hypothetical protein [Frankia nepalensis]MBL7495089.1 hypothetical protein [Frankia nepalensis]MBL7515352.1 hypothetical protein [Frankia nepalensis]MBL7522361.1 hypothetical protein [Frankia nepalensis]MBL7632348.1 hypothetical protein [Frankia nepalensis]